MKRPLLCWACFLFAAFMSSYAIARRVPATSFRVVDAIEMLGLISLACSAILLWIAVFGSRSPLWLKGVLMVSIPLLFFFLYALPYGLSYAGSRYYMPNFDLWYLAIGLTVIVMRCVYDWWARN